MAIARIVTPPATRPAAEAFKRHALACRLDADVRRCQICRDLEREASAEAFRRAIAAGHEPI